jgi:hypothetical protein
VPEEPGDERARRLRQLILGAGLVEGVLIALEQGHVGVHARAGVVGEGLGHEGGPHALLHRHFLHHQAERHDVVGRGQGVGVAQVNLLLARRTFVVAVLHADAHRFEHRDRHPPEVAPGCAACGRVAAVADGDRDAADLRAVAQQEELDLRVRVAREAHLGGLAQVALEHPSGIGVGRATVGEQDVAKHPGHAGILAPPGQQLERRRVGTGDHVCLMHPGEALDGRPVEADAVRERALSSA